MSELFSSSLRNDYPGPNFTLLIWYRTFAKYQTNIEVIHLITSFTSTGTQSPAPSASGVSEAVG